ncbi:unnamed protein product [Lathyrus sativus]|nr:unnamed protein product [Lathyrus sativus]
MQRVWNKLKRLQPILKPLNKKVTEIQVQLTQAMKELIQAQHDLQQNLFNHQNIDKVKKCTDHIVHLNQIKEGILMQKSKINWLKLGDGVNTTNFKGINIPAIRSGKMLTMDLAQMLIRPIEENEIWKALSSIGDTKAQSINGLNVLFFKSFWQVIKNDVIEAIMEFFETGDMHMAINSSLVKLIPKSPETKNIKDMRLISCYNIIYKIISKILTARLAKVTGTVVDDNQSAFVLGRTIHDSIMMV